MGDWSRLEEDWRRMGGGLEEDWRRIGGRLEEDWRRIGSTGKLVPGYVELLFSTKLQFLFTKKNGFTDFHRFHRFSIDVRQMIDRCSIDFR